MQCVFFRIKTLLPAKWVLCFVFIQFSTGAFAQLPTQKEVRYQTQFWTSLNTTARISQKWSVIGDIHIRRNNFMQDPSFYLLRGAGQFAIKDNLTIAAGYAHMWIAPTRADWQAAGIRFDFSPGHIQTLAAFVNSEMEKL